MDRIPTGVYQAHTLIEIVGRAGLRLLLRDGTARRVRHGWYAIGSPPADEVTAVRRGGVLTCLSALKRHGVWVPEHHDIHVRGSEWTSRGPQARFCRRFGPPSPFDTAVDDVPTSLAHAARCLDAQGFVVVCDSTMNLGLMTADQIEYLFREAPRRVLDVLDRCDGRAQSGLESMVRFFLESRNVHVRVQVRIPGVGQVDMLVGEYLIIETDGAHRRPSRRAKPPKERGGIDL